MQPGLARAVPLGIVGFTVGVILAYLIRLAQGLEPNAVDPNAFVGAGMVLGAFISAGFFVWGMGAFDPRMNVHGEHAVEEHAEEAAEAEPPVAILSAYTWQVLTWTIILVLGVAVFAFIPSGPRLQSVQGDGNPSAVGTTTFDQIYNPIREFADHAAGVQLPPLADNIAGIQLSYLLLFVLFVFWTIISLFVVAGLLAFTFSYLSVALKQPEHMFVPWRAIILVLIVGGLISFPAIAPGMDPPMAFLVPAFLIPPLLLFVAYRSPIWLVLLLIGFALPILVPVVHIDNVWIAYNMLLALVVEVLFFAALKYLLSEELWKRIAVTVYGVTFLGAVILTFVAAWPDIWQIIFLVVVEVGILTLLLPLEMLKRIIPPGVWAKFAAVEWMRIIPQFAGWVVSLLRTGLPRQLGQR